MNAFLISLLWQYNGCLKNFNHLHTPLIVKMESIIKKKDFSDLYEYFKKLATKVRASTKMIKS